MTFLQAAAFQWVNPEGRDHRRSAPSPLYVAAGARDRAIFVIVLAVFGRGHACCRAATWAGFGVGAETRAAKSTAHARIFNVVMALLLVASIVPMV